MSGHSTDRRRPLRVAPAPEVLKAIRKEMKAKRITPADRRLPIVAAELVAEPVGKKGLNEGIFYPPVIDGRAGLAPLAAARSRPTTGTARLLVLLVDFSDNPGSRPASDFADMLFSQGTYATGSMYDFYQENSYGQLAIEGQVVGWLRLPQPYSYYVNGENGTGDYPHNAQKMVEDALAIAAQQVDFSQFDADGDGFLDGLFVVHAGGGAEADPSATSRAKKIWSHQFNITNPFASNGVTAYAYLTVPEDCKVGVCCHEFGHMLGLPDLYDTTYHSEGVGVWCVMGAGSWNNGGDTPGHFCAWSKVRLKWVKPTTVKSAKTAKAISLTPVENAKKIYRLWKKGKGGSEYFLIENRQKVGFDKALVSSGLLAYHVNDLEHNNDHPGSYWVAVLQADGNQDLENNANRGDAGDPYPGTARNKQLGPGTTPDTNDHLGNATGVAITGIAVKSGTVTCKVKV
ncbi:MAG TPA: M6 family metalloprotease domain-containing protein [Tepidisphaeraceae bacterium]|jgi:immune inhibitor A